MFPKIAEFPQFAKYRRNRSAEKIPKNVKLKMTRRAPSTDDSSTSSIDICLSSVIEWDGCDKEMDKVKRNIKKIKEARTKQTVSSGQMPEFRLKKPVEFIRDVENNFDCRCYCPQQCCNNYCDSMHACRPFVNYMSCSRRYQAPGHYSTCYECKMGTPHASSLRNTSCMSNSNPQTNDRRNNSSLLRLRKSLQNNRSNVRKNVDQYQALNSRVNDEISRQRASIDEMRCLLEKEKEMFEACRQSMLQTMEANKECLYPSDHLASDLGKKDECLSPISMSEECMEDNQPIVTFPSSDRCPEANYALDSSFSQGSQKLSRSKSNYPPRTTYSLVNASLSPGSSNNGPLLSPNLSSPAMSNTPFDSPASGLSQKDSCEDQNVCVNFSTSGMFDATRTNSAYNIKIDPMKRIETHNDIKSSYSNIMIIQCLLLLLFIAAIYILACLIRKQGT